MSQLKIQVKLALEQLGVTGIVTDFRFVAEGAVLGKLVRSRLAKTGVLDLRIDLAIPELKIGILILDLGAVLSENDVKKLNRGALQNWNIFIITRAMGLGELKEISRFCIVRRGVWGRGVWGAD